MDEHTPTERPSDKYTIWKIRRNTIRYLPYIEIRSEIGHRGGKDLVHAHRTEAKL